MTASEPSELFRRAALGMARLMREAAEPEQATAEPEQEAAEPERASERAGERAGRRAVERVVELRSDSLELLLVSWLGELLYLDEVDGFVFEDAAFAELGEEGLKATVSGRIEPEVPHRQLKGVTYHALRLEPVGDGWQARVIFDI